LEVAEELDQAITQVLNLAVAHQQAGDLNVAKNLYEEVLLINPLHAKTNHYLGLLQLQSGTQKLELSYFEKAVNAEPSNAQYWVSYVDALMLTGQLDKAASAVELGQQHGLSAKTAQLLAKDIVAKFEQQAAQNQQNNPSEGLLSQLVNQVLEKNFDEIRRFKVAQNIGVVDTTNAFVSPDLSLAAFKGTINQLLEKNHKDTILELIYRGVSHIKLKPELVGNKIFTPYFDEVLEELDLEISAIVQRNKKSANIIIASEIYDFGGHTKVIAEMLAQLENPILIITDIFNRFSSLNIFEKTSKAFPECPVFVLPSESYLNKAKRLAEFINKNAKNVFLLSHHEDVVAVAACQKNIDSRFYFVHHADHNPAIGNHVKHFLHVDLFDARAKLCAEDLKKKTVYLPTTSADHGRKLFQYPIQTFSTVSAGSFGKFSMMGEYSLPNIIIESINMTNGLHYHFGQIDDASLAQIYADLKAASILPEKFVYMGNVPSLWHALQEIDAHLFLGAFPVMGAKADIDAQGLGYPLIAYKEALGPRHLNVGSHNPSVIYWSSISAFKLALQQTMREHQTLSNAARAYYEAHCSEALFKQKLLQLCD